MSLSFRPFALVCALGLGLSALGAPQIAAAQDIAASAQLLKAVTERDGTKVIAILNAGSNSLIDTPSRDTGETAMHIVARRGDTVWIRFLASRGADADVIDKAGNTPLMIAILNDDGETARVLLESGAGADFTNSRGETALIRAVQLRKPVLVRLLVAHGADPDRADYVAGLSARDYATRDARSAVLLDALARRAPQAAADAPIGPIVAPGT